MIGYLLEILELEDFEDREELREDLDEVELIEASSEKSGRLKRPALDGFSFSLEDNTGRKDCVDRSSLEVISRGSLFDLVTLLFGFDFFFFSSFKESFESFKESFESCGFDGFRADS